VLGGTSITVSGALKSASSPPMISTPQVARPQAERTESLDPDSDDPENIESRLGSREDEEGTVNQEVMEQMLREREQQQFEEAEAALKEAIEQTPELSEAGESLKIDAVPEGLRIQLIDQERIALFPNGSAAMYDQTRALLQKVAEVIKKMPNNIEISGHTDSSQFAPGSTYTNWELSSDRANASRRVLEDNGIPSSRIEKVAGRADREPLVENPADPTNRRISIVLKNLTPEQAQNLNLLDPSVAGSTPGVTVGGTPAGAPAGRANDDGAPPGTLPTTPPAASNDAGGPVLNDTGAPAPRVGG